MSQRLSIRTTHKPSSASRQLMQRQCDCGRVKGPSGRCAGCTRKRHRIQTKLTINRPGDRWEQEADQIADRILRMPAADGSSESLDSIQPYAHERVNAAGVEPGSARFNFSSSGSRPAPDYQTPGPDGGQPLPASERAFFEPRFGHHFGNVRLFTGSKARRSAASLNARAYTLGTNIVFGRDANRPGTPAGRRLLAHELTHVIQQTSSVRGPAAVAAVQRQAFAGLSNRVVITARRLTVRGGSIDGRVVGTLERGDIVEVEDSGNRYWYRITNTTFTDSSGQQVSGYIPSTGTFSRPIGAQDTPRSYQQIVQDLVTDYRNITVFPAGQDTGGVTFASPYVLYSGSTVQSALDAQWSQHRNLTTRIPRPDGQADEFLRVRDVPNTHQAFMGKGTPEAVQVIAQASVDAGRTSATDIQDYINQGPMNTDNDRRNGRFGVDCSGFTAIAIAEMGGADREAGPGLNIGAAAYRPGGTAVGRGFTQVRVGEQVRAGDVIARMDSNHVMVLFGFRPITIPPDAATTNQAVTGNRTAWKYLVAESSSARPAGLVGEVASRKEFVSVPDATFAEEAYYANNTSDRVNRLGSDTWDLFKPTANQCWDLNTGGNLRIKNLTWVKEFSIVRPPSQRETTPAGELGP